MCGVRTVCIYRYDVRVWCLRVDAFAFFLSSCLVGRVMFVWIWVSVFSPCGCVSSPCPQPCLSLQVFDYLRLAAAWIPSRLSAFLRVSVVHARHRALSYVYTPQLGHGADYLLCSRRRRLPLPRSENHHVHADHLRRQWHHLLRCHPGHVGRTPLVNAGVCMLAPVRVPRQLDR